MNILVLLLIALVLFILAYRFYARWISKKVFQEDDKRKTPAVEFENNVDYVPSKPLVVFSHHFASIAGAGPIVGPILALAFGYAPAFIWVVLGSIFIGGVHDFTVMFASVREKGKSVAEVVRNTIGKPAFLLVITFTIVMLFLVTSVFLKLTVASLTSLAPLDTLKLDASQTLLKTVSDGGVLKAQIGGIASTSVIIITLFAPLIGFLLYKKKANVYIMAAAAIIICTISVLVGMKYPISINPEIWAYIIAGYTLLAAGIPVWMVLQPRDFVNSFFLYFGIAALVIGGIFAGFQGGVIQTPAFNIAEGTAKLGNMWPFLFITVACGACSGFHALVAGGTSSKQVSLERNVKQIGYGAMLLEGLLAIVVIVAVGYALNSKNYTDIVYPAVAGKISNPGLAFALALGILINNTVHLPIFIGTVLGILLIEGFLITTLDTAVRLNRYLFEELWQNLFKKPHPILKSYLFNAFLAVAMMLIFSKSNTVVEIWKVFGSANQLLAALSLLAITIYLKKKNKPYIFTLLPTLFMGVTTLASLVTLLVQKYIPSGNITLMASDTVLLLLSAGIIVISIKEGFIKGSAVPQKQKA